MIRTLILLMILFLCALPCHAEHSADSCSSQAFIQVMSWDSLKNGVVFLPHTLKETTTNAISDFWTVLSAPTRINKKSALQLGGLLVAGGILYACDEEIMARVRRSWQHPVHRFIAQTGRDVEPMGQIERMNPYCFMGWGAGTLLGIDPLREASWQIIISLSIASTIKNTGSLFIGRHRPSVSKGAYAFEFWEGVSFPSGHSSNAFQVATILSHHVDYLPFSVLAYGLASCVAFQRLDANLHWTTDVVFGTTVAKTVIRLHEKRTLHIAPKMMNEGKSLGIGMTWTL